MPFVEEFWNNTTSPCKKWHKKIKWFSILFKPNKCQKNRKENKKENAYPDLTCGLALCGPAGRPSQLAAPVIS